MDFQIIQKKKFLFLPVKTERQSFVAFFVFDEFASLFKVKIFLLETDGKCDVVLTLL